MRGGGRRKEGTPCENYLRFFTLYFSTYCEAYSAVVLDGQGIVYGKLWARRTIFGGS